MRNKFYMKEFQYHDGECFVTFNATDKNALDMAFKGKISFIVLFSGCRIICPLREKKQFDFCSLSCAIYFLRFFNHHFSYQN